MTTRERIKKLVKDITGKTAEIERPANPTHGDYSTNVALVAELDADEIVAKIKDNPMFEKVEAKGGFINFFLSKEYLQNQVAVILKKREEFGQLNLGKKQKIQVEFISANPTGPIHIGNGRGGFFGDVLANVLEKAGFKVEREYYVNDAKANTQVNILGKTALGRGDTYLTEDLKIKIKKLKPKLKKITNEGKAGYLLVQKIQKDNKDFIEKKLKIKYDNWFSEEELYKKGKIKKIYNYLLKKDLVCKKEGAEWLKISQFGASKDEVIVRQTGEPTYFLSDIAYHKDKFDRKYKKIIDIWGADHQGHVPKMKAVAKILDFKGELDILISQMISLKGGLKLSKRKGQVITLEELIDEVGLDAARFFYLTKSLDTQMEFDVKLAKEKSAKSPVYYVQYAHARICSILKKLKTQNLKLPEGEPSAPYGAGKTTTQNLKLLTHLSELELIKQLIRFPEIVEDTARDYQVQRLPQYAVDLATAFHQFYRDCRVLNEKDDLTKVRLSLISATKIVLKNTLDLLGILAPEKM